MEENNIISTESHNEVLEKRKILNTEENRNISMI